jgi:hypothetical protein
MTDMVISSREMSLRGMFRARARKLTKQSRCLSIYAISTPLAGLEPEMIEEIKKKRWRLQFYRSIE